MNTHDFKRKLDDEITSQYYIFRKSFEFAKDAKVIADSNLNIMYSNYEFSNLVNIDYENIFELNFKTFVSKLYKNGNNGFFKRLEKSSKFEFSGLIKIGSVIKNIWVSVSKIPINKSHVILFIFRDTTNIIKMESFSKLQEKALLTTSAGIFITDKNGTIEWSNPAFSLITGYSEEELKGKSTKIFKSGMYPTEFYRNMWTTILSGDSWSSIIASKRKNGSIIVTRLIINPMLDEAGEITHFVAIKEYLTELPDTKNFEKS